MLTDTINDSRTWTATSAGNPPEWYYPLPRVAGVIFEKVRTGLQPVTAFSLADADRGELANSLQPVRDALETGRGFAIIEPPSGPFTAADAQLLYWIVGQGLGRPVVQNVQGTLLYDVRDTGQDLTKGARFSVTNYESSFHTDNSFGSEVVDYVGLLCLHTARSGGRSQVVSGYAVHNELLTQHPEALATLYEPFHVDRRGGVHAGETPTVDVPVLNASPLPLYSGGEGLGVRGLDAACKTMNHAQATLNPLTPDPSPPEYRGRGEKCRELLVRYLRYWIEAGHEKVGQPLTDAQVKALDVLDVCLQRPDLRVEFDLKPGQMYFINNRWILHNRTAFEDHPEPERRRHLVRLWLRK